VSYLVGALLLSRIPALNGRPESDRAAQPQLRDGILEGLRYIRSVPIIRDLTLLGIGNSLSGGAVSGLLIVAAVRTLGLHTGSPAIGVLFGASAVGALAASWLIGPLQRRIRTGVITASGLIISALGIAGWSVAGSFVLGCVALIAWQVGTTTVSLNGIIVRQTITPANLQGRVNTTARMIAWGGQPIGASAAGLFADAVDVGAALVLAAAVALLTAVIAIALPSFRSLPLPKLSTELAQP